MEDGALEYGGNVELETPVGWVSRYTTGESCYSIEMFGGSANESNYGDEAIWV